MACVGITSIATQPPCQRSPPYDGTAPGLIRRESTSSRRTPLLGTRPSRREPIRACTESLVSVCTTARAASDTTCSPSNATSPDGINTGRRLAAGDCRSIDHIGTGEYRPSGDAARGAWCVPVEWSASRARKLRSADGQLDHKPRLFPAA